MQSDIQLIKFLQEIFLDNTGKDQKLNELKQVMLVSEQDRADISIYGKTGMGKAKAKVVDACGNFFIICP